MAKQQASQRLIYKINSSRLRKNKWNLNLDLHESKKNGEVVLLADSTTLRFIRDITNNNYSELDIQNIKREIKSLKKEKNSKENRNKIKLLYEKLDNILLIPEYVCIVINKDKDYDRANKGFFINGKRYRRLIATNGGVKNSTVVYTTCDIYDELIMRLKNNRNEEVELVPAKYESYLGLSCSNSIPVTNTDRILVVKDSVNKFKSDITLIDDTKSDYPVVKAVNDYEIEFETSDGQGLISPDFMEMWSNDLKLGYLPSGVCVRNSFVKGMLFTFDFKDFADKKSNTYIVKDVWGTDRDIRSIDIVLTTSMLKLWNCYDSLEHYLSCCKSNGYVFSVTKVAPKYLENKRRLNYQFIQALDLSDNDIKNLIEPTVNEIMNVLKNDRISSIIYSGGLSLGDKFIINGENYHVAAMMIDQEVFEDPFVKTKIYNQVKNKIDEAKFGRLNVKGNFSIIADDVITLCESMFGLEVKGLLRSGEFYNKYWLDKGVNKVAAFRAPMTDKSNARILRFVDNDEISYWYRYMDTVTILNSWDTTCAALNGADHDGDTVMTTNNPVIINGVEELPAIVCVQKKANKKLITEEDLISSNKASFGNEIGSITNRITEMYELLSLFDKDSKEFNELSYRIKCGQNYQQNSIDKAKGIVAKSMPIEWYDLKANLPNDNDDETTRKLKEFNLSIVANKKPYFMNYIYSAQMREYNTYIKNSKNNCLRKFGLTIEELESKDNKNKEEIDFLNYFYKLMPVGISPCTMNKICWSIEDIFKDAKINIKNEQFDYHIYMSGKDINKNVYQRISRLYEYYIDDIKQYLKTSNLSRVDKEEKRNKLKLFIETFRVAAFEICNDEEELCDVVVELCYSKNLSSKQFVWDLCGKTIITNLLKRNNYILEYPILNDDGDISFGEEKYSLEKKDMLEWLNNELYN